VSKPEIRRPGDRYRRSSPALASTSDSIPDDRLLLTVQQVAQRLAIGTTLAYELVGRGVIPHIRIGRVLRVPLGALEAWISAGTRGLPPGRDTTQNPDGFSRDREPLDF
jgi:excisionase family DNA binding protein